MIKTIIILLIAVFAGTIGDLMLSKGMRALNEDIHFNLGNAVSFFIKTFQTPTIWVGIGALAVFFLFYLIALSRAEISFVLPLTAFSYILTSIFAKYMLHEDVNWIRMAGTVLIFVGVVMVALSSKEHKIPVQSDIAATSNPIQHAN